MNQIKKIVEAASHQKSDRNNYMKNRTILIILICLGFFNSYSQTKMLTGRKHLILVDIPKNWVQAVNEQIPFLVKPDEKNVSENTYMYVYGLDYDSNPDLDGWINGNNLGLKKKYPDIKIEVVNFKFENFKKDDFLTGRYKAVSYTYPNSKKEVLLVIECKNTIVTAVLATQDAAEFEKYINSFKEMTSSLKINAATVKYE